MLGIGFAPVFKDDNLTFLQMSRHQLTTHSVSACYINKNNMIQHGRNSIRSINEINKLFISAHCRGSAAARLNFHLNGTGFAIVLYSLPRLPDCCSCSCIFIGICVHSNKKLQIIGIFY